MMESAFSTKETDQKLLTKWTNAIAILKDLTDTQITLMLKNCER